MVKIDPLELAIRQISETRNLLGLLLTSSESFDYPKAKLVLKELQDKVRQLKRAEAELMSRREMDESVVQFPVPAPVESRSVPEGK